MLIAKMLAYNFYSKKSLEDIIVVHFSKHYTPLFYRVDYYSSFYNKKFLYYINVCDDLKRYLKRKKLV